jgi:hypothetical protein
LKWDYPRTILARFGLIWFSGFRGKDLNVIFNSSPLKPLNQFKANLAGIVLGWSPFYFVSDSPTLHSKWLLLLKIEISLVINFCKWESKAVNQRRKDNTMAKKKKRTKNDLQKLKIESELICTEIINN